MKFDKEKTYPSPQDLVKNTLSADTPDGKEAGDVVDYISEGEHRDEYAAMAAIIIKGEMQKSSAKLKDIGKAAKGSEEGENVAMSLLVEIARYGIAAGLIMGWRMRDWLADPDHTTSKEMEEAMALAEKMFNKARGAAN
jgi:hypothetical protein